MEENQKKYVCENTTHKNVVHRVLAYSYFAYLSFFLLGVLLDILFPIKIFQDTHAQNAGMLFLFFGTVLILWAQYSSHAKRANRKDPKNLPDRVFHIGPYKYTRMPTHWGLFFVMLGFGLVINATFIIITTLISFLLTKFIFVEKQEKILGEVYGQKYHDYKKDIKF